MDRINNKGTFNSLKGLQMRAKNVKRQLEHFSKQNTRERRTLFLLYNGNTARDFLFEVALHRSLSLRLHWVVAGCANQNICDFV